MITTLWWYRGAYKASPPPARLLTPELITQETLAMLENNLATFWMPDDEQDG